MSNFEWKISLKSSFSRGWRRKDEKKTDEGLGLERAFSLFFTTFFIISLVFILLAISQ